MYITLVEDYPTHFYILFAEKGWIDVDTIVNEDEDTRSFIGTFTGAVGGTYFVSALTADNEIAKLYIGGTLFYQYNPSIGYMLTDIRRNGVSVMQSILNGGFTQPISAYDTIYYELILGPDEVGNNQDGYKVILEAYGSDVYENNSQISGFIKITNCFTIKYINEDWPYKSVIINEGLASERIISISTGDAMGYDINLFNGSYWNANTIVYLSANAYVQVDYGHMEY